MPTLNRPQLPRNAHIPSPRPRTSLKLPFLLFHHVLNANLRHRLPLQRTPAYSKTLSLVVSLIWLALRLGLISRLLKYALLHSKTLSLLSLGLLPVLLVVHQICRSLSALKFKPRITSRQNTLFRQNDARSVTIPNLHFNLMSLYHCLSRLRPT